MLLRIDGLKAHQTLQEIFGDTLIFVDQCIEKISTAGFSYDCRISFSSDNPNTIRENQCRGLRSDLWSRLGGRHLYKYSSGIAVDLLACDFNLLGNLRRPF